MPSGPEASVEQDLRNWSQPARHGNNRLLQTLSARLGRDGQAHTRRPHA
jgi:hypothetical protein